MAKKKEENIESKLDIKKFTKKIDKYLEEKQEETTQSILEKLDEQIDFKVNKRMKEEEKAFIRGKNRKIICRDIIILILLAICIYFGYCLYKSNYFKDKVEDIKILEIDKEIEEYDSAYYIEKYHNLVDNFQIEDEGIYDLYNEGISNQLILKIAYKNLSGDKINNENEMITFNSNDLDDVIKRIFGKDKKFKNEIFSYNNIKFMFYNKTYLGLSEENSNVNFKYEIIEAKEEKDKLIFEVVVGKLDDGNLVNFDDDVIVKDYDDEELKEYQDELSTYKYTFKQEGKNYIFEELENIS